MSRMNSAPEPEATRWRADIDGLRALAVMGVLLFHAGLGFEGGFVGVDVFFVLSGFLITRLIQTRVDAGTFSFGEFYKRRILRILPAQCVMASTVLVFSAWILIPEDLVAMGHSLLAQSAMFANNHFNAQSGYFDTRSEYKPLLHTWSLSLEEQFYLVYPLLLLGVHRLFGGRWRKSFLLALALCSLALGCSWLASDAPAAFYLLPGRAWELLLGGLVSQLPRKAPRPAVGALAALLGLLLVVGSMWTFGGGLPFPGLIALVPCVGTGLLLWGNTAAQPLQRALSLKPLVLVGKISYSLYLWHWPLLVLGRYSEPHPREPLGSLPWLAAAFALAWLSYTFVEEPFRRGLPRLGVRRKVTLVVCGNLVLICCGLLFGPITQKQEGIRRLDPDQSLVHSHAKFLLWGDSHASKLEDLFANLCEVHRIDGWRATAGGVAPLLGAWRNEAPWEQRYAEHHAEVLEFLETHEITHVVLAARWSWNVNLKEGNETKGLLVDAEHATLDEASARAVFELHLAETLSMLREHGAEVWILRQVPLQARDVGHEFALAQQQGLAFEYLGVTVEEHRAYQAPANKILDSLTAVDVHLLDPLPWLPVAEGRVLPVFENSPVYKDDDHLSPQGVEYLRPLFEPLFASMSESAADGPAAAAPREH